MKIVCKLLLVMCAIAPVSVSWAATAYTDPGAFNRAVSGYNVIIAEGFDSQAAGTSAADYPMLQTSAIGLASDGSTSISLPPIATDAYTTLSSPNSLGVSGSDHQFLSGNSDRITFRLTRPVRAFGIRLVGNPSPTGDPAIPFWKMSVNVGGGFDAFSSTEPGKSLEPGSDVYFIGVVSDDEAFERVDLFSDNDPDAVFSFNLDDIVMATSARKVSLAEAKELDDVDVLVPDVIVTRVHSDRFNVEEANRSQGMAVLGSGTARHKVVALFGTVTGTSDDERVIRLLDLQKEEDSTAPGPLGMGALALGGKGQSGKQIGCDGSVGPNNIGLDVAIWGTVTYRDWNDNWITVDDGSGRESGTGYPGVKVVGAIGASNLLPGMMVRVVGSCAMEKVGTKHYPVVRVAGPTDLLPLH